MWAWDGAAIGRVIKREREKHGPRIWTQRFLAKKAGVSHAYVSHLEAGQYKRPSKEKLEKIFAALGLDIRMLVSESEESAIAEEVPRSQGTSSRHMDNIQANLLTVGELDEEQLRQIDVVIQAMVEDLKRRRREDEDAGRSLDAPG